MKLTLITAKIIIALYLFAPQSTTAFDFPDVDPWYFQSNEAGYLFWVPDKAQHYYGSILVAETLKLMHLPAEKVSTPIVAFGIGFLWEVYQERKGIGFSNRDLFADALGVATSELMSGSFKMWVDYSTADETITFNIKKFLG